MRQRRKWTVMMGVMNRGGRADFCSIPEWRAVVIGLTGLDTAFVSALNGAFSQKKLITEEVKRG